MNADRAQGGSSVAQVLVVGAGPVGLTAALVMAETGLTVHVIEKATAPSDLPRAISIVDETLRTMARFGIVDTILEEANVDTGSRYLGLDNRLLVESKPTVARAGFPAKAFFDQPVLESALWSRAERHPGVRMRTGLRAVELHQDAHSVRLTVREGERSEVIEASWLVGADGGRSFVRDALGIPLVGTTQTERWIVVDLLNETTLTSKFAEFHCVPARPHVVVPGVNGRLRIEFMLFDDEDEVAAVTPEAIRELVRPFRPDVHAADIRRASVYVAHRRLARQYRSGRAFLAGDAAHLMPPFAGQGLNAGIRDAINIGWKIADVELDRAHDLLLDSYEAERRRHAAEMVRISGIIGSVVMTRGMLASRIRDAIIRSANRLPRVRRWLSSMRFIAPTDYSAGVAAPPSRAVPAHLAALVGHPIPQPTVIESGGDAVALDVLLGSSWALVTICSSDVEVEVDARWELLAPRRVRISGVRGSAATWDRDGVLAGSVHRPVVLVVRPDRYVAAAFVEGGEQEVLATLGRYLRL